MKNSLPHATRELPPEDVTFQKQKKTKAIEPAKKAPEVKKNPYRHLPQDQFPFEGSDKILEHLLKN